MPSHGSTLSAFITSLSMGIDIYARYAGQSAEAVGEQVEQYLTATAGSVGYLREAYHGEPYVTRFLVREGFETGEANIPAATLRARLPEALRLADLRERTVYEETDEVVIREVVASYTAFVEFCERAERETGKPVTIIASY